MARLYVLLWTRKKQQQNPHTRPIHLLLPIHCITFYLQRLSVTKVSRSKWGNLESNMTIGPGQFKELRKYFLWLLSPRQRMKKHFWMNVIIAPRVWYQQRTMSSLLVVRRAGEGRAQDYKWPLDHWTLFAPRGFVHPSPPPLGTLTPCPASGSAQPLQLHGIPFAQEFVYGFN